MHWGMVDRWAMRWGERTMLIIVVFVVKNVIKYISDVLMAYVSNGVIKDVRNALFAKLTTLSLGFFHS